MRNLWSDCEQREWNFLESCGQKCFGEQRKTDGGVVVLCSFDILVGRCPILDGVPLFWWSFEARFINTGTALIVCVRL